MFSILRMFIRVDDVTNVETQFDHSKFRNFISSEKIVKNFVEKSFSIKLTKIWKESQELNVLYIRRYEVTCVKFKLYYFIILLKLIKTLQNFVKSSFSIKLIKYVLKIGVKFLPQVPFKGGLKCNFFYL